MPDFREHGGGCCGIHHLYTFNSRDNNTTSLKNLVNRFVHTDRLSEIVLNHDQIVSYPILLEEMKRFGFVLTTAFYNGNSDNNCYVFHRAAERLPLTNIERHWTGMVASPSLQGSLPDVTRENNQEYQTHIVIVGGERIAAAPVTINVTEAPVPAPAPVRPITLAATTFHNVYRTHVGPGYDTEEDARAARRTRGLVRRKNVSVSPVGNVNTEWQDV